MIKTPVVQILESGSHYDFDKLSNITKFNNILLVLISKTPAFISFILKLHKEYWNFQLFLEELIGTQG